MVVASLVVSSLTTSTSLVFILLILALLCGRAISGSSKTESSELTLPQPTNPAVRISASRLSPGALSIVQTIATTSANPPKSAILPRQSLVPGLLLPFPEEPTSADRFVDDPSLPHIVWRPCE